MIVLAPLKQIWRILWGQSITLSATFSRLYWKSNKNIWWHLKYMVVQKYMVAFQWWLEWIHDVHGFQNADLSFITLPPKDASQLERDKREQSGSAKWKLERAKRITLSRFGQVFKRKGAVTEKFLNELFKGKTFRLQLRSMVWPTRSGLQKSILIVDKTKNVQERTSG